MKKILTFALLLVLIVVHARGQSRECFTVPIDSMRRANNPSVGSVESFESWLSNRMQTLGGRIQTSTYRIPTVVHVVHNGEPTGVGPNISIEQIQSQIDVLNEDFRRLAGTNGFNMDPKGADAEIEFYLAETDPDGNVLSEPGVNRIDGGRAIWPTGLSQSIENQLKPSTIWDPERYFNIWTVNFGGFIGRNLLGYAQFPDMSGLEGLSDDGGSAQTDGVVIGYQYFGSSEKGNFPELRAPFDLGRTATHEVGHWLGLRHIWGDGDCSVDDFVSDTPNSSEPTNGCPSQDFITCTEPSMYENYMDYSNDACMNIFTQGQKARMMAVLENSPRRPYYFGENILGTSSIEQPTLAVFPNPTSSFLYVTTSNIDPSQPITITNISGQKMTRFNVFQREETVQIQIDKLPEGVYFLELISKDHQIRNAKFFISR